MAEPGFPVPQAAAGSGIPAGDRFPPGLDGAAAFRDAGFAAIEHAGSQGMITLRADFALPAVRRAVKAATGCAVPRQRGISRPPARARTEAAADGDGAASSPARAAAL